MTAVAAGRHRPIWADREAGHLGRRPDARRRARAVVERAKHLLLDGIGCALIGAQLPWSRVGDRRRPRPRGPRRHASSSAPAAPPARRPRRCSTAPSSRASNSTTSIPSRRCTAARWSSRRCCPRRRCGPRRVRGAELLLAAIAGFEVGPRVGYTLHGSQMLDRGWHSGSVFGTHSAAMASGKLRGLSPAQLEDALGLAGTQSSGLMAAQFEAMSKRMHHGLAARNGFYAAGLAAARLHRHQAGLRARIRRIPQRFRRGPQSRCRRR